MSAPRSQAHTTKGAHPSHSSPTAAHLFSAPGPSVSKSPLSFRSKDQDAAWDPAHLTAALQPEAHNLCFPDSTPQRAASLSYLSCCSRNFFRTKVLMLPPRLSPPQKRPSQCLTHSKSAPRVRPETRSFLEDGKVRGRPELDKDTPTSLKHQEAFTDKYTV